MTPEEMIRDAIKERGMTIATAAKRADVKYSALQPSLAGRRKLRADEYLRLCSLFGLDPRGYREA